MPEHFILISTSGFPEIENFKALESTIKAQAYNFGSKFTVSLLIPGSLGLQTKISLLEPHLDLIYQAGIAFGNQKNIPHELVEQINTPILSKEEFYRHYLKYEEWCKKRLHV
jgi:hypothetical protein